MKKILQVVSTLEQGGTEAVVLNYLNNIKSDELIFDFLVIWGDKKGYYEDMLIDRSYKIFKMKNPPNRFFAHGKELNKFFTKNKYDIVHIHAMSSLRYVVAKAAKKNGVKTVIYHSHNSSNEKHLWLHSFLKKRLNMWCDIKLACSKAAGDYMYNGKYQILNNAIDVKHFAYNEQFHDELRQNYSLSEAFVIGHIGRLTEVKNQKYLISCMPYVLKNCSNAVLFCIGSGDMRQELEIYAKELGVWENMRIIESVGTDIYKYYSMFDVLAFPSKFEGLSMVMVEAQANGLPIIASDTISKEHKINGNVIFLPISENVDCYNVWANDICSQALCRKCKVDSNISDSGYSIKNEAPKLQNIYLNS